LPEGNVNHEIPTHQRSSTKVQKMRYFLLPPMEATADSKSQPADALQLGNSKGGFFGAVFTA